MKTMKWLIRREFWEHKGAFFWTPIVVGVAMVVLMGGTMLFALAANGTTGGVIVVNGHTISKTAMMAAMPLAARMQISNIIASNYIAAAAPLFAVLPVVVFFYCLAALYDDRRDRSILFWKSLPVSDQMTVLSKVLAALCVMPVITIAAGTATALLLLLLGMTAAAFSGMNLFGLLLSDANFYLAPFHLLGLLPVYILWAIPTVGWLLMVSAWARSKVFLWAVGAPLLSIGVVKWVNYMLSGSIGEGSAVSWFAQNVVGRVLLGLVPGVWLPYGLDSTQGLHTPGQRGIDLPTLFTQSWLTLATPGVWIGVLAGAAMIFVAMRLRRWREEG